MVPNIFLGEEAKRLGGSRVIPRQTDYRFVCASLDRALEISDSPIFEKMSNDACKTYAIGRFQEFLSKGVSYYIRENPFYSIKCNTADHGRAGIVRKHPVLDAYRSFVGALELHRRKDFDEDHLGDCCDELSFLFEQFLKQGARAFVYEHYVVPDGVFRYVPVGTALFPYHCSGGPIRDEELVVFFKNALGPLMEATDERIKRQEDFHKNWLERYYPTTEEKKERGLLESKGFEGNTIIEWVKNLFGNISLFS